MIHKQKKERPMDPMTFDVLYPGPRLGMDEVGTGCIAGPIVVAGVVLPGGAASEGLYAAGLKDSKQMTAAGRERLYDLINCHATFVAWSVMPPDEIARNEQGIALDELFSRIVRSFRGAYAGGTILMDGNPRARVPWAHVAVQKGDQKSLSISAASVIAKVRRDRLMVQLATEYPDYGFDVHKGYPTKAHLEALEKYGACDMHRTNTAPVQRVLSRGAPSRA